MRLLMTGATGFVGSHVARSLVADGHDVAILMRPGSPPARIIDLLPKLTRVAGDLSHVAASESAVGDFGPEAIVHLAWAGVGNAHRNSPIQIANIQATVALVQLANRVGANRWIGVGSQAEYGPCSGRTATDAPTKPTTLYGVTKLSACLLAERLCDEMGIAFAWLRLFSSYGPGDDPQWMIPYLITRLLERERPALTGAEQRWDYIYVSDAAEAVAKVATDAHGRGIYNLGSGESLPLRNIIEAIRDEIDPKLPLGFGEVPYRPDQVMHLEADVDRLRNEHGWEPRVGLAEGLKRTVEWYRERRSEHVA